jgi:asparagine synthase (glutamine-hydrolysing)
MLQAIEHRGPDGRKLAVGEGGAFGHCLLATDDGGPETGRLVEDENFLAMADCRLDNREELTEALGLAPAMGDSEILLAGYRLWGENLASHLLGDFAFIIWNKQAGRLYAARDHFGIKPLYYAYNSEFFVFCSDLSGIFASGLIKRDIRDVAIADFLASVAPAEDSTSYSAVWRLPPGHSCILSADDLVLSAYWKLPPPEIIAREDAPGEFRRLLSQAIAARLRGGPVGAMLSGGLDSSSITCLAAALPPHSSSKMPLPTFSMVFDATPELNERNYIETVLAQGKFAPCFIPSDDVPPFALLESILAEQHDLFLAPNLACSRRVYHAAHAAGVRVLLDGHGGDEVAPVGVGRLVELAEAGRWFTLWRQLGEGVLSPGEKRLPSFLIFVKHYSFLRRLRRIPLTRRFFSPPAGDPALSFLNPDFAARTRVSERVRAKVARAPNANMIELHHHYNILTGRLQSYVFEILDRTAAAAGVEARYPFWDKRLVEFCLSLDPVEKLNKGWGRLILRRALQGILPREVQWRSGKFNFLPHLATAMIRNHAKLIEEVLADKEGQLDSYVNLPALRDAYSRLTDNPKQPNGYEVQSLWRAVILAYWLKRQSGEDIRWQI